MKVRSNLKLVETLQFERKEGSLWEERSLTHSLHQAILTPEITTSEMVSYFIDQYSERGHIVLDPFCGAGTTGLEALLMGRIACMSDKHPLAVRMTKAKVEPADLSQITLALQLVNLRRPISIAQFSEPFKPFFDLDTFRELVNLKVHLQESRDPTNRFIELLALDLLHGHTAGYFSAYTSPLISVTPEEQNAMNLKRGSIPDYRATVPRILRKAAGVLRDGTPSVLTTGVAKSKIVQSDARDLAYMPASSVDLVVTTPPVPFAEDACSQMWIRNWFAGLPTSSAIDRCHDSVDDWQDFMNETLLELARVTKRGGRAVLDLKEVVHNRQIVLLDDLVLNDVQQNLSKFWEPEALYINLPKTAQIKHKERDRDKGGAANRVLVLRRR